MSQKKPEENKINRRTWLKYLGGAAVVVAVGGGYYIYQSSTPPPPSTTSATTAAMTSAAGATSAAAQGTLKIGIAGPFTNASMATTAYDYLWAATIACEEINYDLLGNKIELVQGDTAGMDTATVNTTFQRLLTLDKVDAVINGPASQTNIELDLFKQYQVPYLISGEPNITGEIMTSKGGENYPTVWSYAPNYFGYRFEFPTLMKALSDSGIVKLHSPPTVACITSDMPYDRWIMEDDSTGTGLKTHFKDAGWSITLDEMVPFQKITDWSAILAKIRANPPDLIVNGDTDSVNEVAFLDQFLQQPTNSHLFFQWGPNNQEFIDAAGAPGNGVICNNIGACVAEKYAPSAAYREKFKARWGREPQSYGYWVYDQFRIYFEACKLVGDPKNYLEVARTISQTTWDKSTLGYEPVGIGAIKFDQKTHLAIFDPTLIPTPFMEVWDGKRNTVWPNSGNWNLADSQYRIPSWFK